MACHGRDAALEEITVVLQEKFKEIKTERVVPVKAQSAQPCADRQIMSRDAATRISL
jgi:hypothetical protein